MQQVDPARLSLSQLLRDPRLLSVFFLGFSSGLPFLLLLATLSVWLTEEGISKTEVGLLAWITLPYAVKFLIAPIIDQCRLPWLTRTFGQRRGWMLLAQVGLAFAILGMASTHPGQQLWLTAWLGLCVGSFSALQDIVVEAYRIEVLPPQKLGLGASTSVLGYRLGMLCSGAGTIYLSAYFGSWHKAYACMALCVCVGMLTTLLSPEPPHLRRYHGPLPGKRTWQTLVRTPLETFLQRRSWLVVLLFVASFKAADTVLNVMSMPFLLELGFSKVDIAHVAKTFGIFAMVVGGICGGILCTRLSLRVVLTLCVLLQMVATVLFLVQSRVGNDLLTLLLTMGVENLACGMGQVGLIAYLSRLCAMPHTAMHFAILSSFASFLRLNFSALSGILADQLAWSSFYLMVFLSSVPALVLLLLCERHFTQFVQDSDRRRVELIFDNQERQHGNKI